MEKAKNRPVRSSTDLALDVTREQWEDAVFREAVYYTIVSGRTPSTRVKLYCRTWEEAKQVAGIDPTKMVYAVNEDGRSVMLIRALWSHYDQIRGGQK